MTISMLAQGGSEAAASLLLVLFIVLGSLALYFLPAIVAVGRGHKNRVAITILTFFTAWTFIGWVVALVWAFTGDDGGSVRKCPTCAELINVEALVCKHCGQKFTAPKPYLPSHDRCPECSASPPAGAVVGQELDCRRCPTRYILTAPRARR